MNFANLFLLYLHRTLCGRSLALAHIKGSLSTSHTALLSASAVNNVSIKVVPNPGPDARTYEEKNAELKRELSPHLTIYKPQLTSMLSITHRGTG